MKTRTAVGRSDSSTRTRRPWTWAIRGTASAAALTVSILAGLLAAGGLQPASVWAADQPPSATQTGDARSAMTELLDRRETLAHEIALLEMELPIAKTTQAYVVVDLAAGKILFKVRGRTLKSYEVRRVEISPASFGAPSLGPEAFDRVYRLDDRIGIEIPNPLALQLAAAEASAKAAEAAEASSASGKAVSGRDAEGSGAAGRTGEGEAGDPQEQPPDASSLIAPDPPPRFVWRLEDGLSIYVREVPETGDPWVRGADKVAGLAKRIGRIRQWLGGGGGGAPMIYLYMDEDVSREAYRSLLPGQQVILLAPSGS